MKNLLPEVKIAAFFIAVALALPIGPAMWQVDACAPVIIKAAVRSGRHPQPPVRICKVDANNATNCTFGFSVEYSRDRVHFNPYTGERYNFTPGIDRFNEMMNRTNFTNFTTSAMNLNETTTVVLTTVELGDRSQYYSTGNESNSLSLTLEHTGGRRVSWDPRKAVKESWLVIGSGNSEADEGENELTSKAESP